MFCVRLVMQAANYNDKKTKQIRQRKSLFIATPQATTPHPDLVSI
jgi:hypothetical protein